MRLPDELVGEVFLWLQPNCVPLPEESWWLEGSVWAGFEYWTDTRNGKKLKCCPAVPQSQPYRNFRTVVPISSKQYDQKYIPALLAVAAVSRQWRAVSFFHPFWHDLAWQRLLENKVQNQFSSAVRNTDDFFRTFTQDPRRLAAARRVYLDLSRWRRDLSADALAQVLESLPHPERIKCIVLDMGWAAVGHPRVAALLASKFPAVRQLRVGGTHGANSLYGLGSGALRTWANHWKGGTLTHLSLEEMGEGMGFSWAALSELLRAHPTIEVLTLGFVRNGIDLTALATMLPGLRSLGILFSASTTPRNQFQNVPEVHGDLSLFHKLGKLGLRKNPLSNHLNGRPYVNLVQQLLASVSPRLRERGAEVEEGLTELHLLARNDLGEEVNAEVLRLRCLQTVVCNTALAQSLFLNDIQIREFRGNEPEPRQLFLLWNQLGVKWTVEWTSASETCVKLSWP
ncbi:hypothetical protein HK104_009970 [Borealophlyctis nickersoniae]|nr:hypothetical protein HK104_009970 [Borealophlyctis nickersoniae]